MRSGSALIAAWLAACQAPATFPCTQSSQCGAGTCEPAGYCSVPDVDCDSGRRYDATAAPELANTCVPPPASPCPSTYTMNPATGHGYRVTGDVDYDGGIDACTADGTHLAVLDDAEEEAFVLGIATPRSWIGFDDLTTEGTFAWITGAPVTYTHWEPNEPSNANNAEDCAYLDVDGWNDTSCGDQHPALCECEAGYTPRPTPACRTMTGGVTVDGRLYFIHTDHLAQPAARAACRAIGAELATIGDATEATHLGAAMTPTGWIGLSGTPPSTWAWDNGAPFGYTNWATGYPSTLASDDCVEMATDGVWGNFSCANLHGYVCECDPAPP